MAADPAKLKGILKLVGIVVAGFTIMAVVSYMFLMYLMVPWLQDHSSNDPWPRIPPKLKPVQGVQPSGTPEPTKKSP